MSLLGKVQVMIQFPALSPSLSIYKQLIPTHSYHLSSASQESLSYIKSKHNPSNCALNLTLFPQKPHIIFFTASLTAELLPFSSHINKYKSFSYYWKTNVLIFRVVFFLNLPDFLCNQLHQKQLTFSPSHSALTPLLYDPVPISPGKFFSQG